MTKPRDSGSMYYDRSGQPIGMMEWATEMEGNRRVAADEVDGVRVSTVWLGLDHSFGGGCPLIFETMVFGGPLDMEQDRYSTEAEAIAGHVSMLARVKAAMKPRAKGER